MKASEARKMAFQYDAVKDFLDNLWGKINYAAKRGDLKISVVSRFRGIDRMRLERKLSEEGYKFEIMEGPPRIGAEPLLQYEIYW